MKRSLGQGLEPRSESVSRIDQNRPIVIPGPRLESSIDHSKQRKKTLLDFTVSKFGRIPHLLEKDKQARD